ncbi:hypothetical protein B0H66DRAFT_47550 [Apodospora peruviana]|uniref:Uncharacterized protein n=1 Tax=Apodospora peruviana TaxID=516989 RepID=A0AAE0MGI3_9PEZI|nr:hypothetical protein B0H66DRAFT_47550 [Apodospora peruviana]
MTENITGKKPRHKKKNMDNRTYTGSGYDDDLPLPPFYTRRDPVNPYPASSSSSPTPGLLGTSISLTPAHGGTTNDLSESLRNLGIDDGQSITQSSLQRRPKPRSALDEPSKSSIVPIEAPDSDTEPEPPFQSSATDTPRASNLLLSSPHLGGGSPLSSTSLFPLPPATDESPLGSTSLPPLPPKSDAIRSQDLGAPQPALADLAGPGYPKKDMGATMDLISDIKPSSYASGLDSSSYTLGGSSSEPYSYLKPSLGASSGAYGSSGTRFGDSNLSGTGLGDSSGTSLGGTRATSFGDLDLSGLSLGSIGGTSSGPYDGTSSASYGGTSSGPYDGTSSASYGGTSSGDDDWLKKYL